MLFPKNKLITPVLSLFERRGKHYYCPSPYGREVGGVRWGRWWLCILYSVRLSGNETHLSLLCHHDSLHKNEYYNNVFTLQHTTRVVIGIIQRNARGTVCTVDLQSEVFPKAPIKDIFLTIYSKCWKYGVCVLFRTPSLSLCCTDNTICGQYLTSPRHKHRGIRLSEWYMVEVYNHPFLRHRRLLPYIRGCSVTAYCKILLSWIYWDVIMWRQL
jgi:hypothetical protein